MRIYINVDMNGSIDDSDGRVCNCDPSFLRKNLSLLEEWREKYPRHKGPIFDEITKALGDPIIAEMIWIYYGIMSFPLIDAHLDCFSQAGRIMGFWKRKKTIRSLIRTNAGKELIWKFLHASANGEL